MRKARRSMACGGLRVPCLRIPCRGDGGRGAARWAGSALAALVAAARLPAREVARPSIPSSTTPGPPPRRRSGTTAASLDELDLGPPFAVTGLQPSHGPWTGGTRTTIAGRGFSSNLEVWIGSDEARRQRRLRERSHERRGRRRPRDPRPGRRAGPQRRRRRGRDAARRLHLRRLLGDAGHGLHDRRHAHRARRAADAVDGRVDDVHRRQALHRACTFTDATDLSCITPPNGPGLAERPRHQRRRIGRRGRRRLRLQRLARRLPRWALRRRARRARSPCSASTRGRACRSGSGGRDRRAPTSRRRSSARSGRTARRSSPGRR